MGRTNRRLHGGCPQGACAALAPVTAAAARTGCQHQYSRQDKQLPHNTYLPSKHNDPAKGYCQGNSTPRLMMCKRNGCFFAAGLLKSLVRLQQLGVPIIHSRWQTTAVRGFWWGSPRSIHPTKPTHATDRNRDKFSHDREAEATFAKTLPLWPANTVKNEYAKSIFGI